MSMKKIAITAAIAVAAVIVATAGALAASRAITPATSKTRPAATKTVTPDPAPKTTPSPATPAPATPSPAPAAPPTAPVQSDPWAIVSEYYGDVTSGDYADAWNLLGPSMQAAQGGYASFTAGYSGTGSQNVYEVGESGDQVTYYLQSVNPDGTVQWYEGTATVWGGQVQSTDVTQIAGDPLA